MTATSTTPPSLRDEPPPSALSPATLPATYPLTCQVLISGLSYSRTEFARLAVVSRYRVTLAVEPESHSSSTGGGSGDVGGIVDQSVDDDAWGSNPQQQVLTRVDVQTPDPQVTIPADLHLWLRSLTPMTDVLSKPDSLTVYSGGGAQGDNPSAWTSAPSTTRIYRSDAAGRNAFSGLPAGGNWTLRLHSGSPVAQVGSSGSSGGGKGLVDGEGNPGDGGGIRLVPEQSYLELWGADSGICLGVDADWCVDELRR